jgi:hypothetical protein
VIPRNYDAEMRKLQSAGLGLAIMFVLAAAAPLQAQTTALVVDSAPGDLVARGPDLDL